MNRMRVVAVLLTVLIATVSFAGDTGVSWYTMTFLNGRGWADLDENQKVFFVSGLMNGLRFGSVILSHKDKAAGETFGEAYLPHATVAEIRKGVDTIYADPANVNVPVIYAVEAFKMRLDGKPQAQIDKNLEEFRKMAHESAMEQ